MVVDPACGVEIDPDTAAATVQHNDQTFYFCSTGCRDQFAADPESFLESPLPHLITSGGMLTQRVPYYRATGEFELSVQDPDNLQVGDRSVFSKPLTDTDVRRFAEASGDTNALHLSQEFAEKTRFGRRIVHGTLVSGTISAALAALPGLTIYLSQNIEFHAPVDIGESVTAICEIIEDLGNDQYELTTTVETPDEIVVDGTATVLIDPLPNVGS